MHFQAIVGSLKTKKAQQMLQFAKLSSRNKGPTFHNLTIFITQFDYFYYTI